MVRWWESGPTLLVCAEEDNGVVYADSRSSPAQVSEMDERNLVVSGGLFTPRVVWGGRLRR